MTGKIDFLNTELSLSREKTTHLEKLIKEYKPPSPFASAADRVLKELHNQGIPTGTASIHNNDYRSNIQLENRTKWFYKMNPLVEAAEPFVIEVNSGANLITLRKKPEESSVLDSGPLVFDIPVTAPATADLSQLRFH